MEDALQDGIQVNGRAAGGGRGSRVRIEKAFHTEALLRGKGEGFFNRPLA
jgi:hypothetical protein